LTGTTTVCNAESQLSKSRGKWNLLIFGPLHALSKRWQTQHTQLGNKTEARTVYGTWSRESANFAISRKNLLLLLLLLLNKALGPRSHNKKLSIAEKCIALRHDARSIFRCSMRGAVPFQTMMIEKMTNTTHNSKEGPRKEAKEEERE